MGYTRYWTRTGEEINDSFIAFVNKVIKDCEKQGIKLGDGMGEDAPIVSKDGIYLNGDASKNLEHETFVINNEQGWDCCKTARKPYDYAVKTILDEAEMMGIVENVSSDGGCLFTTDDEHLKEV